jgi:predicted HAD superfamily Cof-like phosphohydrolase
MTNYQQPKQIHESINSMYNSVVAFMQACDQEVSTTQKTLSEIDSETLKLRASLIQEEFEELLTSKTRTEELDALLDLMYVSLGTLASFGYKPYTNDTKLWLNASFAELEEHEKIENQISGLYAQLNYRALNLIHKKLLTVKEKELTFNITDSKELFYILNIFILEIYDLGNRLFPQFNEAFEEVHRSNMSKLENGKALKNEYGKVIKSKSYSPPNLTQFS